MFTYDLVGNVAHVAFLQQSPTSFTFFFNDTATTEIYTLRAFDYARNGSGPAVLNHTTPPDTTPPSAPVLSVTYVAPARIAVSWTRAVDNVSPFVTHTLLVNGAPRTGDLGAGLGQVLGGRGVPDRVRRREVAEGQERQRAEAEEHHRHRHGQPPEQPGPGGGPPLAPPPMRKPMPNALDIDLRGGLTHEVTPSAGAALLLETGRRSGVMAAAAAFRSQDVDTVAVCFLHSYANPSHEQQAAELLRGAGFFVSLSSEVSAEYGEFERFSTAVINAFAMPAVGNYFGGLNERRPGMEINVLSETIPTHEYESKVLTKAFEEITGIKVNHQLLGEGEVVQAVQTQMQTKRNLYDAYINDSDLIGTHYRYGAVLPLSDFMAGAGKAYTNPGLDLKDFIGAKFVTAPDGKLYQLPDQQFANLYWFRADWFARKDLQERFRKKYGYQLGVPLNWSAYEDIAEFFILFQAMEKGFVARAREVESLLGDSRSTFLVVTTLETAPAHEAAYLARPLLRRDYDLTGVLDTSTERITSALPDYDGRIWLVTKANGKVVTLDAAGTIAEAVAVADGRIAASFPSRVEPEAPLADEIERFPDRRACGNSAPADPGKHRVSLLRPSCACLFGHGRGQFQQPLHPGRQSAHVHGDVMLGRKPADPDEEDQQTAIPALKAARVERQSPRRRLRAQALQHLSMGGQRMAQRPRARQLQDKRIFRRLADLQPDGFGANRGGIHERDVLP